MYLSSDTKLWWLTRTEDLARPTIESWEDFVRELKKQFLPTNNACMAGEALRRLRHTGTVREYVKHFASLMLDVKNMSDEDKFLNFTSGFQNWAKVELRRQGARDVQSAMAMADALVDYRSSDHGEGGGQRSKERRPGEES
ncbi:unnamed protein product [Spirodela intermedia]|uniref:Retrotransposon gag domain-containing protein n=1 Tax=Spirodela intermedia TaxID=51605 RepID=A0A7I8JYZ2_SPIIN|nr:unnamed protein product [Spirodela intermedia]